MDVQQIEEELQELSEEVTRPRPRECLACYLDRMLTTFGCAKHRFTRRWARGRARGTEAGLVRWAATLGGLCCDCEVVFNTLSRSSARRRGGVLCAASLARLDAPEGHVPPGPVVCSGVDGGR